MTKLLNYFGLSLFRHCSHAFAAVHNPEPRTYIADVTAVRRAPAMGGRRKDERQCRAIPTAIYTRYRRWRRYRETVRELQGLSTRELNDLGINRGDISRLAREASRL